MPKEIDPRQLIANIGAHQRKSGRLFGHHPVEVAGDSPLKGRVYALFETKSDADKLVAELPGGYAVGSELQEGDVYTELDGEQRAHGIGPYNKNSDGVKGDIYHWKKK